LTVTFDDINIWMTKYSFFPRTIRDWSSLQSVQTYSVFHNPQLTFLAANAMHPSGNGLSPLLGIYQSMDGCTDLL